jgi:hypothetical protein
VDVEVIEDGVDALGRRRQPRLDLPQEVDPVGDRPADVGAVSARPSAGMKAPKM